MYSFPIRLHLSEAVSFVLSGIGFDIVSEGNLLIIAGEKFLVDQECVGLKMLITGMVLVLIVLAYYERKHHQQFGWRQIILAQVIGFVFNILANFSRIIIFVLFKIGPEKIMHDLVGIACLLSYNLLPIVLLVSQWTPKSNNIIQTKPIRSFNLKYVLYFPLLMILLFLGGGSIFQENHNFTTHINNPLLDGLQKEQLENNILQYSNKDILVYVKPPASPFRGTHDPRFCWRGSGYELKVIKQEKQNGYSIYTGELIKGSDKIYTAWWYQDELTITNSEWAWRTKSVLNSKAFSLININADTKSSLNQAVRDYLGALAK
jgi:exosortase N